MWHAVSSKNNLIRKFWVNSKHRKEQCRFRHFTFRHFGQKKFCNKYRRPRSDLPEDSGAAEVVNDASLEVWGFDGVVAPVRNGVGVDPVVTVDAVARDATVTHPLAARVRTLCVRNKFEIDAFFANHPFQCHFYLRFSSRMDKIGLVLWTSFGVMCWYKMFIWLILW